MKQVRELNIKELTELLVSLGKNNEQTFKHKQYITFLIYKKSKNIIYRIFPKLLPRYKKWREQYE